MATVGLSWLMILVIKLLATNLTLFHFENFGLEPCTLKPHRVDFDFEFFAVKVAH